MQSLVGREPVWTPNVIGDRPAVWFKGGDNYTNAYFNLPTFPIDLMQAEAFVVLRAAAVNPSDYQPLWFMGGYVINKNDWFDWYDIFGGYPQPDGSIADDFGSSVINYIGAPPQPLTQFNVYEVSSQATNWSAWFNGT